MSDGEWNYTWEKGRQLKQMVYGVEANADYKKVEFAYNAEGLRIQKKITEKQNNALVTTTVNYILHGKNIVHMTHGSNTLHFWYDAVNKPAIVEFNGTKYGYLYNLQGDIVGIVGSFGNEVVKYNYDAWGKPLHTTGSLAATLGKLNPFRYRVYVYDEITDMYYLRARYYNSELCRFVNRDGHIV